MTDRSELLQVLRTILSPGGTGRIEHSPLCDLFEAYVLCGVVRAAQAEGWAVSLHDMSGTPVNSALFRRSPGNIYAGAGSQNFTHFVLSRTPAPALEAHIGIKVTGKSDVVHECDIALLPEETAEFCRLHRVHPRSSQLILFVECKFLAGSVPLHLGRGFVGLDTELKSQYGECQFVANTSSSSVMKMLARQKRRPHEDVRPGTDRYETFQAACRVTLQNYFIRERP